MVNESSHPARLGGGLDHEKIRCTAEQVIRKHKTAEKLIAQGKTVANICRNIEATQSTYHRWKQSYKGIHADEVRR